MKTFDYTIKDKLGIHARPAGLLVKKAGALTSSITISKGKKVVDAKRIFGIMGLSVKCGETITMAVEGEDEDEDAEALEDFMKETW